MADYLWLFATAGGAIILGLALAYALLKQRKLDPTEHEEQDRKVHEIYDDPPR